MGPWAHHPTENLCRNQLVEAGEISFGFGPPQEEAPRIRTLRLAGQRASINVSRYGTPKSMTVVDHPLLIKKKD